LSPRHNNHETENTLLGPGGLAATLGVSLERHGEKPLFVQLYSEICRLILTKALPCNTKLPASRALASDLGISRTTVLSAYDQLAAEGYVEARRGAGVFVVDGLAGGLGEVYEPISAPLPVVAHKITTSKRTAGLVAQRPQRSPIVAFDAGKPDLGCFPFEQWSRFLAKSWRQPAIDQLYESENAGYVRLKQEISTYLARERGLACSFDQVILTSSTHEAVEVLSQVLLDEGDEVWIEDPVYHSALHAFIRAGVRPVSVRVDEEGFCLSTALAKTDRAKLAFITPSRQYPLGQTMSLSRRLALIDWARTHNSWVIEDDYDSEYRYRGPPLQPLAARDGFKRTIYLGSFSKVMFPALRLSYIVAPKALVKPLLATFQSTGKQASILAQPALAEFMASGYFARHIRRTRRLYAKRYAALCVGLKTYGSDLFEVKHYDSGMHVVARFKHVLTSSISDVEAAKRLRQHHLIASALSQCFRTNPKPQGLILGFAAVPEQEIAPNVKRLTQILRQML